MPPENQMADKGQGKGLLIVGGVLLVVGIAGIGVALGLFINPAASQVQEDIETLKKKLVKMEENQGGSQVQDDIEAVKIQLMELRKEMDENKDACPLDDTWTSLGAGCYLLFTGFISWDQARDSCHQKGGFLAEIDSKAELDTLVAAMTCKGWGNNDYPPACPPQDCIHDIVGVHIGLSKKGGNWQWDNSGKNLTSCSTRWGRNSPSSDGNCAGLWSFSEHGNVLGAHWNDYPCSMKTHVEKPFGVICEI